MLPREDSRDTSNLFLWTGTEPSLFFIFLEELQIPLSPFALRYHPTSRACPTEFSGTDTGTVSSRG